MFRFYHSLVPLMWKWFAYLHCIIWSEQGHIFYILSLLCSDDAVICFDIVWKKYLSIQAWVRVMLFSVCKYHPLVLSLSLFLTCDISLGYMEKQREGRKKKSKTKQKTPWTLPLFGAFCEALLVLWLGCAWLREDALHLALRVEGIFLLQNVSHTQREKKGRAVRAPLHFIRM